VVFEDFFTPTAHFRIYENAAGGLAMSVDGKIGVDDQSWIGERLSSSFVATFLALHPERAEAPADLVSLDARYQEQRASWPTGADSASVPEPAQGVHPLNVDSFNSTVCVNMQGHCGFWGAYNCQYLNNSWDVCANGYASTDVSFGWNVDSVYSAYHLLRDPATQQGIGFRIVSPGYFVWNSWNSSPNYSFACLALDFSSPQIKANGLGVTVHKWHQVPC
jgi:hypothetical protein